MEYVIEVYQVGKDAPPVKIIRCGDKNIHQAMRTERGLNVNMSDEYYTELTERDYSHLKETP